MILENQKNTATAAKEAAYEIRLEKFLPTPDEIEQMGLPVFEEWIDRACIEIPKRKIARDPLTTLKKEISKIINDDSKSEIEKEETVYRKINQYRKFIDQQFQLQKLY